MAAGASSSAAARQRWELENNVQRDEQVTPHPRAADLGLHGFYRSRTAFPLLLMPKRALMRVRAVCSSKCLEQSGLSPRCCL